MPTRTANSTKYAISSKYCCIHADTLTKNKNLEHTGNGTI